jgi:hypothetical protein
MCMRMDGSISRGKGEAAPDLGATAVGRRSRVLASVSGRGVACLALLAMAAPAAAQGGGGERVSGEVFAGGELESYLRLLQTTGRSARYPWSLRGFSASEVDRLAPRDSLHPWAGRLDFSRRKEGGFEFHLHAPHTRMVFNSAFPYGGNDGPIWAGRGLTTAFQAGFTARYRQISLTVAPVGFRTENASFVLAPPLQPGGNAYSDWRRPTEIDLPQRYGADAYTRVDPGQSTLRADLGPVAAGISTANQYWGPASEYPLVLGNNAPGFAHVFAGTSRPLNLWIGRAHGRFVWGRLEQSEFSPAPQDSSARFMSGVVAVFTPRGIPGLEVGGSRFFHLQWPSDGIGTTQIVKPLETFTKVNLSRKQGPELLESVVANQIASLFARWVFPGSGLEVYGEFASEDHRHNLRDFILEPDHNTASMLGFRKAWERDGGRLVVVRGEALNAEAPHLQRGRRQEPFYIHAAARQGHTHRGQILGSPAAYGGAASTLAADYYHPGGRWTVSWRRTLRQEKGEFLRTRTVERPDVMQSLGTEALFYRGRWEITAGIEGVYNFNRNFDSDAVNLNALLGVQARL